MRWQFQARGFEKHVKFNVVIILVVAQDSTGCGCQASADSGRQPLKPLPHMPGQARYSRSSSSAIRGPWNICPLPQICRLHDDVRRFARCDYVQVEILDNRHHRDQNGFRHLPPASSRPAAGVAPRRHRARECGRELPAVAALLPLRRSHIRRMHEPELVSTR